MSALRPFAPLLLTTALLVGPGPAAAAKPAAFTVAAADVAISVKSPRRDQVGAALRTAVLQEAHYYDAALRPITMRITIDKMGFKSAGKALAGSLPLVGMFTGSNQNILRGRVDLIDQSTGKAVQTFKIKCDDDTQFSAGDGVIEFAKIGTSFLPFGGLISAAIDMGQSAAADRSKAEQKMVRGFVMLSYKAAYGAPLYRSFAARRKADWAASAEPIAPAVPAPPVASAAAPTTDAAPATR